VSYSDPFGLCKNAKGEDASDAECAEKLKAAQDADMRCPAFQPSAGTTHCNQATLNVAADMGAPLGPLTDSDGNALTANEMAANLAKSGSGYREISAAEGQALANKGILVLAALAAGGHGHIATLRPNPSGGRWPLLANVGTKNAVMGLNYAWSKADRDRVKFYTPGP